MNNLLYFMLIPTAISIIVTLYCFYNLRRYGKRISLGLLGGIREHRKWVDRFLLSLLIPVGLIESMVRMNEGHWGDSTLFVVHMYFVVFFAVTLFLMRFVWTGIENKKVHRFLSKCFILFFFLVALTGFVLISQLF